MPISRNFLVGFFLSLPLSSLVSRAAQTGPYFPSHRFPTQKSFHLGFSSAYVYSASNFVEPTITQNLTDNAELQIFRQTLSVEIQPSRQFSAGVLVNMDKSKLGDDLSNSSVTKFALADQIVFGEFRAVDTRGYSLGFATVVKFPAYKNITYDDLIASGDASTILLGDGQSDFSLLTTSELWLSPNLRSRLDAGLTFRTEGFAPELPLLVSLAYVNPKIEVELRITGNFPVRAAEEQTVPPPETVQAAFAGSQYALADAPWGLSIAPHLEAWISPKIAITADYSASLVGNRSPHFYRVAAGIVYRWSQTNRVQQKTFEQVDISTDQEEGTFEGEQQMERLRPKVVDPRPIKDEAPGDEEFN